MKLALISLYSLTSTGGGERFTFETARSASAAGVTLSLWGVEHDRFERVRNLSERLATPLIRYHVTPSGVMPISRMTVHELLAQLHQFDWVWVHQYMSNDLIFDVAANCAADQQLLLTNLGHEGIKEVFDCCFQPAGNHHFVEISRFASLRSRAPGRQVASVSAGIWRSAVAETPDRLQPFRHRVCSVGRLLPHKGIDVTLRAIQSPWKLDIIGPDDMDRTYTEHLRSLAYGRDVTFHGRISDAERKAILAEADFLVASSTTRLYDGRLIPQAELFGLVLCEAVAANCLPVASSIPPFVEIMETLGLPELVYQEGDPNSLAAVLDRAARWTSQERHSKLVSAKRRLIEHYAWDSYFDRVLAAVSTPPQSQNGRHQMSIKALDIPVLGYLCRLALDSARLPVFRQQAVNTLEGLTLELRTVQAAQLSFNDRLAQLEQTISAMPLGQIKEELGLARSTQSGIQSELRAMERRLAELETSVAAIQSFEASARDEHEKLEEQLGLVAGLVKQAAETLAAINERLDRSQ